jgi:hypothetical protein
MTTLLLKNVPERIKRDLKGEARKNRRSMNQEALVLLEQALKRRKPPALPSPLKPKKPFTHDWLLKAMKEGRE